MKPTQKLHELGQSLWVDNITRPMLAEGTLKGYIDDLSVTGGGATRGRLHIVHGLNMK